MTTRIGTGGPGTGVTATASAARVTAAPGQPFKAMMSAGKNAILSGAESAVTRLPGGPILAAALRPSAGDVGPAQTAASGAAGLSGVGSSTPEGTAGTAGLGSGLGGGT